MSAVRVVVPGRPPGANDLIRLGHWRIRSVRAEWKQKTEDAVVASLVERPNPRIPFAYAQVRVTWRCKIRRKRDYDNLVSGLKPLLDGLVSGGILEDDSTECLMRLGPFHVEVGAARDETILEIEECESDGFVHYARTLGLWQREYNSQGEVKG